MSDQRIFPVSFAQQRLLFLDRLDPGTSAYNLTRAIRVIGALDQYALRRALNDVARRQAALRTRFHFESENDYQILDEAIDIELPILDLQHFPPNLNRGEYGDSLSH
jgi:hypothetical protein